MWFHYSEKEIKRIKNVKQVDSLWIDKPEGLYFAKEDEWPKYCVQNGMIFGDKKYRGTNIDKILYINDWNVVTIQADYGMRMKSIEPQINWKKIAEKYNGVMITGNLVKIPKPGLFTLWTDFDVDTLVIWNRKGIKIELV